MKLKYFFFIMLFLYGDLHAETLFYDRVQIEEPQLDTSSSANLRFLRVQNNSASCWLIPDIEFIKCHDNYTNYDQTDDTYYFRLTVMGGNTSSGDDWCATLPVIGCGEYGEEYVYGPFPLGQNVNFSIIDEVDSNCGVSIYVQSPNQCFLSMELLSVSCDNNGTPSNMSDDSYTLSVDISGCNYSGNWVGINGTTGSGISGVYSFGPFSGATTIQVADATESSCVASLDFSLPTMNNVVTTNATYCEAGDGTITVFTSGNSSLLEYSIDGIQWQASNYFDYLSIGSYTPQIRFSGFNCILDQWQPVYISEPQLPIPTAVSNDVSDCETSDGTISISPSSEIDAFRYSIDGVNFFPSRHFESLPPGTYPIWISNPEGACFSQGTDQVISSPSPPQGSQANGMNPTDCNLQDGHISMQPQGGTTGLYEYSFDGGTTWADWPTSNIVSGLSGGVYDVRLRNSDGTCSTPRGIVHLYDWIPISVDNIFTNTPSDCNLNDGIVIFNISSGPHDVEYQLNGQDWTLLNNNTINDLAVGDYEVVFRYYFEETCLTSVYNFTIEPHPSPVLDEMLVVPPSDCNSDDGQINIFPEGILQILISV